MVDFLVFFEKIHVFLEPENPVRISSFKVSPSLGTLSGSCARPCYLEAREYQPVALLERRYYDDFGSGSHEFHNFQGGKFLVRKADKLFLWQLPVYAAGGWLKAQLTLVL